MRHPRGVGAASAQPAPPLFPVFPSRTLVSTRCRRAQRKTGMAGNRPRSPDVTSLTLNQTAKPPGKKICRPAPLASIAPPGPSRITGHSVVPFSSCSQSLPASESFPLLGFRGFFIPNSSLSMDAENWMLEIPPWPPTRRAVMVGRGMKVRMP